MSRVLPVLFNTDMVRAILDGRKMVTRRVIKPQPWKIGEGEYECNHGKGFFDMGGNNWACRQCGCGVIPMKGGSYFHAPYQPGDILYVRESYCPNYFDKYLSGYRSGDNMRGNRNAYKADYHKEIVGDVVPEPKWRPSIHMPKDAARIWLKVMDVRVERLQDMKPEDARKEGIKVKPEDCVGKFDYISELMMLFSNLWDSTIKKPDLDRYGWNANPWVWVIEFERCGKP